MVRLNHFDLIAPYYDRFIQPRDVARFSALVGLPTAGLVLDVGGGTGQKSLPLLEKSGGVVIADSSMGMLTQAKSKAGLATTASESEQLPFDRDIFDRVIMVDAFHHVADQRLTIRELWRVTKPGGRIVIEEPDIHTFAVKLMALFEKVALMRSHFRSPQAIAAYFDYPNAGVSIENDDLNAWIIVDKRMD